MAYVRFTDPAIDDLKSLKKHHPSALKQILKKILLLEQSPYAGEPLVDDIINYRKLTVGDRHWRIVWLPRQDSSGEQIVEIAEIWAIGARNDSEVYEEARARVNSLPKSPTTSTLKEVVDILGKVAGGFTVSEEAPKPRHPEWLRRKLQEDLGLADEEINEMSLQEAKGLWFEFMQRSR